MWLIAGLGNPGRKYSRTRHNIGFMVVEEIAERFGIDITEKKEGYRIGRGSFEEQNIILIEPLLYMNTSGNVVRQVFRKFMVQPECLIVIHDDLDMETGKLRIRKTGSSGGHKGIESIIQNLGRDFIRLKIGIGREHGVPAEEYVLHKFTRQELSVLKEAIQNAADAVCSIITGGVDRAMNTFN
jgi:PTH1 family peptidyl-tRNA hydrolase